MDIKIRDVDGPGEFSSSCGQAVKAKEKIRTRKTKSRFTGVGDLNSIFISEG